MTRNNAKKKQFINQNVLRAPILVIKITTKSLMFNQAMTAISLLLRTLEPGS